MIKSIQIVAFIVCVGILLTSARAAEPLNAKGLEKLMEEVGKTAKNFKKNTDEKNSAQLAKDTARLSEIFGQTVGFWKGRKVDDAVKWSQESEASARAAAAAVKAQDWDKVKTHIQSLQRNCKSCHDAHREKLDNGYRIK